MYARLIIEPREGNFRECIRREEPLEGAIRKRGGPVKTVDVAFAEVIRCHCFWLDALLDRNHRNQCSDLSARSSQR